jgi:hypothetical protein
MAAAFPEALVPDPQIDRGSEYQSGLVGETYNEPESNQRLPVIYKTLKWLLNSTEKVAFKTFFDITLSAGLKPFTANWMTNVHPDAKFLYFTDTYEATLDGQVWTIEAVVEVIR